MKPIAPSLPLDLSLWADMSRLIEGNYGLLGYSHAFELSPDLTWGPAVVASGYGSKPEDGSLSLGLTFSQNLGGENEVIGFVMIGTDSFIDPAMSGTAILLSFFYPWGDDKPFIGLEGDLFGQRGNLAASMGASVYVPVGGLFNLFVGPYLNYGDGQTSWSLVIGMNRYFDL